MVAAPPTAAGTDVTLVFAGDVAIRLRVAPAGRHSRTTSASPSRPRWRRTTTTPLPRADPRPCRPDRAPDHAAAVGSRPRPTSRPAFARLVAARRGGADDVRAEVAAILARVAADGDAALLDYTARFDRQTRSAAELRVTPAEIAAGGRRLSAGALRAALELAAARIEAFHRRQLPAGSDRAGRVSGSPSACAGGRSRPVGLYVPGGTAAYPSSVLMNALPAKVAGVDRLVMTVPAPDGAAQRRWCWSPPTSPGSTRSTGSAAPRRSARSPSAPRPSPRSTRSSAPAMPTSPRPSARCSAGSAST